MKLPRLTITVDASGKIINVSNVGPLSPGVHEYRHVHGPKVRAIHHDDGRGHPKCVVDRDKTYTLTKVYAEVTCTKCLRGHVGWR